jgi:uncharacterized DUF497 family protein
MAKDSFEWNVEKDLINQLKHGVSFQFAQYAFADKNRVIERDLAHSHSEYRYLCYGRIGRVILTVRFTDRKGVVRIFGAGYWRQGKKVYEQENKIH